MAVRRSLGQGIADAAFVKRLATQAKAAPVEDATTVRIEMALNPIDEELKFPKGEPLPGAPQPGQGSRGACRGGG